MVPARVREPSARAAPPGSSRVGSDAGPCRVLFLGAAAFDRAGSLVMPGRHKVTALAAHLLLGGEVHSRNALASLLWPELDTPRGLAAVRNALWRLAQLLGSGWLSADHAAVRVRRESPIWVDVHRFRRLTAPPGEPGVEDLGALREAVELYRGDFLKGLHLGECPAFEEWLALHREELRRLHAEALGRLAAALQAAGQIEEAIVQSRRWVAADAFNEGAHRALMRALAAAGRRAEAQAQFDQCAAILARELGVRPDPATVALRDAALSPAEQASPAPPPAALPPRIASTLPAPVSEIIGRETEIALLTQRLDDAGCRLLTITGLGGVGKTTLALEIARRVEKRFPGGARFVPLTKVTSADRVEAEIAAALGIDAGASDGLRARLLERLRLTRVLLILDDVEHLLPALGVVAEIVERAPSVRLLVTSRERLDLRGEWELALGGLRVAEGAPANESGAVALFEQAARRASASFALSPENAPTVRRICGLLDGIPLAIELCAAWARAFGVGEIAAQVERDLGAFQAPRDAPVRQRSMRASFAHSYALLDAREQAALRRLTVFQGGAGPEAAAAVAGASTTILASLVEKSLVRRDARGRYDLHAIVRQFARETLDVAPEESAEVLALHATFTLDWLVGLGLSDEKAGSTVGGAGVELENVRAAWATAVDRELFAELSAAIASFGLVHEAYGRLREGAASVGAALSRARAARPLHAGARRLLVGRLLAWQGRFLLEVGAVDGAAASIEESLHLLREAGDEGELARTLLTIGRLSLLQGNAAAARWALRGSLALSRTHGLPRTRLRVWREFVRLAVHDGDDAKALRMLRRAVRLAESLDDRSGIAACAGELGVIVERAGDLERAERAFREGVAAAERGHDPQQTALLLEHLGQVRLRRGEAASRRAAEQDFVRCLEICASLGLMELSTSALRGLGLVALAAGDAEGAELHLGESLRRCSALGARKQAGETLEALAQVAARGGDRRLARRRLHAALATGMEIGATSLVVRVLRQVIALSDVASGRRGRSLARALDDHPPRPSEPRPFARAVKGPRAGAELSTLTTAVLALPCSDRGPDEGG